MSDRRWFRPAHHQKGTLHVYGFWFGWWFLGIQVGKAWVPASEPVEEGF